MALINETDVLIALGTNVECLDDGEIDQIRVAIAYAQSLVKHFVGGDLEYAQRTEYLPVGQDERAATIHPRWDYFNRLESMHVSGQNVHFRSPGNASTLRLSHRPVWTTDIEVYEDTSARAGQASSPWATALTQGSDYWVDVDGSESGTLSTSGLIHRYGTWPDTPRSVKVVYYGGEKAARLAGSSADIKYATVQTAIGIFNRFRNQEDGTGPKISESIGKYSYSTSAQLANALGGAGFAITHDAQRALSRLKSYGGLFKGR